MVVLVSCGLVKFYNDLKTVSPCGRPTTWVFTPWVPPSWVNLNPSPLDKFGFVLICARRIALHLNGAKLDLIQSYNQLELHVNHSKRLNFDIPSAAENVHDLAVEAVFQRLKKHGLAAQCGKDNVEFSEDGIRHDSKKIEDIVNLQC